MTATDGAAPWGPPILHVDMDAFFVAVEVLDRPELRGRPVVVGGDGARGVVAAASYEARAFGVRSAMPSTRARRLCPHAVFVGGRYDRYREVSRTVFDVFRSVTPLVEGISLDEAFLDVSGARRLHGDVAAVGHHVRREVHAATGLWSSVGAAPRKLTAKLASEAAKPRAAAGGPVPGAGVVVVAEADELAFLHRHPVEALWGVGPATLARLRRFGVRTVGDLAHLPESTVVAALGRGSGRHLHALAWARDARPVVAESSPKSVGHEETFRRDLHTPEALHEQLVRLADAVGSRLRRAGLAGRTVQIKVRFGDFRTITRSATSPEAVDGGVAIARVAGSLLEGVDPSPGVRLLGVSVTGLGRGSARQLSLEDIGTSDWTDVTRAVDDIRSRFGDAAIGPAATATPSGIRLKRQGDQQWGPTSRPGR